MSLCKIEYVCDDCENNVIIVVPEEQIEELKYCPFCSCNIEILNRKMKMNDIQLSPDQLKALNNGLNEIVQSKDRQVSERDLQKEIIEKLHDETKIEKKIIRKLASARHSGKTQDVLEEQDQFTALVETLNK